MGGPGSGNHIRLCTKTTTESQHRVDIRYLKKQGLLHAGSAGTLSWSRNGEKTGSIGYRIEPKRMILNYRHKPYGGDWVDVEETVYFDKTPCNYGGFRYWFHCPGCGRRVALLYGAGKYFLCRHCHNLTYASQQEDRLFRLLRKAQNIRERLGLSGATDEPILFKPKGMHQKTFDRLRFEVERIERRMNYVAAERFGFSL